MPLIGDGRTPDAVLVSLPMIQNAGGVYSIQMAGQPVSQIQRGQDGHTNDGSTNQINNYHDIQEVVAVAVNNSAEFARVGYFDMTTKSGTQQAARGSGLLAPEFLAGRARLLRHHQARRQGAHHRGQRRRSHPQGQDVLLRLLQRPALAGRHLLYAQRAHQPDARRAIFPNCSPGSKPVIVKDPLNNTPFPGNVIPANRINPVSLEVQNGYLPAPDQGGPHDQARNFGYLFPYPGDVRWWDLVTGRIDHKISDKNTIHGRLSKNWGRYIRYIDYPALIRTRTRPNLISPSRTRTCSPRRW